jgi:hypothetical protein
MLRATISKNLVDFPPKYDISETVEDCRRAILERFKGRGLAMAVLVVFECSPISGIFLFCRQNYF